MSGSSRTGPVDPPLPAPADLAGIVAFLQASGENLGKTAYYAQLAAARREAAVGGAHPVVEQRVVRHVGAGAVRIGRGAVAGIGVEGRIAQHQIK